MNISTKPLFYSESNEERLSSLALEIQSVLVNLIKGPLIQALVIILVFNFIVHGQVGLSHDFRPFAFKKVFKIGMILYYGVLFPLVRSWSDIYYDSFAFGYFNNAVIQVLILEVVIFFEPGLALIGAVKDEILLFFLDHFFLFGLFYRGQKHAVVVRMRRERVAFWKHRFY